MKWLKSHGRTRGHGAVNERKAAKLYAEIDRTGFYRGTAQKESRSLMNVTFRLPNEELEKRFDKEATAAGLDGLKGHRSVGGMRASIYNAFPGGRRGRARRVHAGVRADPRIDPTPDLRRVPGRERAPDALERLGAAVRRCWRASPRSAGAAAPRGGAAAASTSRRRRRSRLSLRTCAAASMKPRQCSTSSGASP